MSWLTTTLRSLSGSRKYKARTQSLASDRECNVVAEPSQDRVRELYETLPYLEAYAAHTDLRTLADPHEAVGGRWEEVGRLQLDLLIGNGLRPRHSLLDIGCGTLRAGRHLIRYLEAGNYTGMDISPNAIAFAEALVRDEGLWEKSPRLLLSVGKDLRFEQFNTPFDYLLANSVFTHLPAACIEECFAQIGQIMHPRSIFLFSYWNSQKPEKVPPKKFLYPHSFFNDLATAHGFALVERPYHVRPGKIMIAARKNG
ncbi:MAG: class I SAM-dependent methyltransferase [Xanthobacteraceae bacterium]